MAKGYSLDALAGLFSPVYRSGLAANIDLNNLYGSDNFGTYYQYATLNATPANNYPVQSAGTLEVMPSTNVDNVMQRYTDYNTNNNYATYVRTRYAGVWGPWVKYVGVNDILNTIYPVGIMVQFEKSVNPNTLFPGQTWVQRTHGRTIRAATVNTEGTASWGQIGSTNGADTLTLSVNQLPGHAHNIADHNHTMAHTHSIAHTHAQGTAASAGAHTHVLGKMIDNDDPSLNGYITATTAKGTVGTIADAIQSSGAHTHTVTIPAYSGDSGGSSAGYTGTTSLNSTGNVGSGATINVLNSSICYAFWARTA